VKLVPSSGGVFEVELDGRVVFSKRSTGRHCTAEEVIERIDEMI
jgi:selenoprotein W-related protein